MHISGQGYPHDAWAVPCIPVSEASHHAVTFGLSIIVLFPLQVAPRLYSAVPPGKKAALEVMLLEALLDLVDRYWSGCKSLHGNEVFQGEPGRKVRLDLHLGPPSRQHSVCRCCSAEVWAPHLAASFPLAVTAPTTLHRAS